MSVRLIAVTNENISSDKTRMFVTFEMMLVNESNMNLILSPKLKKEFDQITPNRSKLVR